MGKDEPHIHQYAEIEMVNVIADNPNYSIGDNGSWAFLMRTCKCGNKQAFEYGQRKDTKQKLEELKRNLTDNKERA